MMGNLEAFGGYLVKYGPEVIDAAETLADARQKRNELIAAGGPSRLYVYRPGTGKRWY